MPTALHSVSHLLSSPSQHSSNQRSILKNVRTTKEPIARYSKLREIKQQNEKDLNSNNLSKTVSSLVKSQKCNTSLPDTEVSLFSISNSCNESLPRIVEYIHCWQDKIDFLATNWNWETNANSEQESFEMLAEQTQTNLYVLGHLVQELKHNNNVKSDTAEYEQLLIAKREDNYQSKKAESTDDLSVENNKHLGRIQELEYKLKMHEKEMVRMQSALNEYSLLYHSCHDK